MGKDNSTSGQQIAAAERRIKVLELRKGGASYRAIATHLKQQGVACSHETVRKDLYESLKNLSEKEIVAAEELRLLELQRIDELWLAYWSKGLRGDIASTWVLIGLSKRRSELLPGMCAMKNQMNLNLTREELEKMTDEELDRLIEELER